MAIQIDCVSWIDRRNLPDIGLLNLAEALFGDWDDRTVIGLIATSNPTPPTTLPNISSLRNSRQYRALTSVRLNSNYDQFETTPVLDPGWTPPYDKRKLRVLARPKSPPPQALKWHAGESSSVSGAIIGRQNSASSIQVPAGGRVVASTVIKFRAGDVTNTLGIEEANSPFHVPWVWCEWVLVEQQDKLKLLCTGSAFPSHSWYINGKQVATSLQKVVHAKPDEVALTTGRSTKLPRLLAKNDRSEGSISKHIHTVPSGGLHQIELTIT